MGPVAWIKNGLADLLPRVWGAECPRGAPVPREGLCADCDSVLLTELAEGLGARVTCLEAPASATAVRLASAGVLPGTAVHLLQRRPVYVIRIGFSELAIDRESAGHIRVRPDEVTART